MSATADMLSSITTPDTVESRLGTLQFADGAPSEETAALLYTTTSTSCTACRRFSGPSQWTILRLYNPLQPFFDKSWRPSEIEGVS